MDSSNPMESPATIDIDGRAYRWTRLRLRDYVELEQRYAASRPDPMVVARRHLAELSETLQRHLLGLAFDAAMEPASPTVEELHCWLLGSEGMSLALELGLRFEHANITPERCRRAVYEATGERRRELLRVVAAATGISLREECDEGNGPCRSAAASASASGDAALPEIAVEGEPAVEPEWIGERYATD